MTSRNTQAKLSAPWALDFTSHSFELVSPELPTGCAWLVNCLLESGISAWNPWELVVEGEWSRLSAGHYRYQAKAEPWYQTLPALSHGRSYEFDLDHSCRATHRWASTIEQPLKLILFVRDPRDMLYSQWRRSCHNQPNYTATFTEFLQAPYHHYPCSHVEYIQLFLLMWQRQISRHEHLVVRFEDYRLDAAATYRQVLEFLAIDRSQADINQAVMASDFKVLKHREDRMAAKGQLPRKFNFAGQPYEYMRHDHAVFDGLFSPAFDPVCDWLGYESFASPSPGFKASIQDPQWLSEMVSCITGGQGNSPLGVNTQKALRPLRDLLMIEKTLGGVL